MYGYIFLIASMARFIKSVAFGLIVSLGIISATSPAQGLTITERLAGKILLQVESHGEGWYVHPKELRRYYLGTPDNAFAIMRSTGLGITDSDLVRIAEVGADAGGDRVLAQRLSGRILLQVQSHGEAWYVNPDTLRRYYLGRPDDAFALMRSLGLGITNIDLAGILVSPSSSVPPGTVGVVPTPITPSTLADAREVQRTIIINDLNQQRNAQGLVSLRLSSLLSQAAQAHTDDIAANKYFSLTSPSGVTIPDRIAATGYKPQEIGMWLSQVSGGAPRVISDWSSRAASAFTSVAMGASFREMGVGITTVDGYPAYSIILAISEGDYFTEKTVGLIDRAKMRSDMLVRLNQERQAQGLSALKLNDQLTAAAQAHTDDMIAQSYFSHTSLDGRTPADRVTATGYQWRAVGENIAQGQYSVTEVMDGWMASPGHRENILTPGFTEVGISLSLGQNKDWYTTEWAQEFGTPR